MGYNAILISAGLSVSRSLKIHGIENSGVLHALQFLQDINSGKSPNLGKKIIVIGGGNVAVDVARSVRRLGIDDVTMACLESRKEMPAWEWEINEAQEEGIKILPSRGPKQILGKDGKVSGYEMVEVKSVFDEQKRFNPSFYEDRISSIEADTIIVAIGQSADLSFLKDSNIKLNERGQILVDKNTLATSESGVFVSGEIAAGPGNAVDAVASGQRVAKIIDAYLKGEDLSKIAVFSRTKIDKLPKDISEKIRKIPRAKMPIELASKRINTFNIFELGFSEKDALVEARRCLSCGAGAVVDSDKCALCLTCVRICPYETPSAIKNTAQVQIEKCQACGLCSTECPAGAISLRGWDADLITNEIKNALADLNSGTSKTLILACSYHVNNWSEYDNINNNTNSKLLWLICTNKLSELEMLKAFENGADKLVIITCPEGECRYNSGGQWIQKKVGRVKKFLNELGIGEDKIAVYPYSKEIKEKWSEIIK